MWSFTARKKKPVKVRQAGWFHKFSGNPPTLTTGGHKIANIITENGCKQLFA